MNTGHGPGYRYDRRVGEKGDLTGFLMFMYVIGGIIYILSLIF